VSFHVDGSTVSSASSSPASACSPATGTSPASATSTHSEREGGIDCQQRQDKYGKTDTTHDLVSFVQVLVRCLKG
jgi:hypothetical protein